MAECARDALRPELREAGAAGGAFLDESAEAGVVREGALCGTQVGDEGGFQGFSATFGPRQAVGSLGGDWSGWVQRAGIASSP